MTVVLGVPTRCRLPDSLLLQLACSVTIILIINYQLFVLVTVEAGGVMIYQTACLMVGAGVIIYLGLNSSQPASHVSGGAARFMNSSEHYVDVHA